MKRMRLRYAGTCAACGTDLPAKTDAFYDSSTKSTLCLAHGTGEDAQELTHPGDVPDVAPGDPGASARREFDRRHQRREQRIRTKHPKVGSLILALSDDPQSTKSWATGASGEERLGARLNELSNQTLRVLHDRRIPGSRANIDHIAVTPTGVWVVDAKKYKGRPELRVEGGLLRPRTEKVIVGGRDQTKLIDGMRKQLDVVSGVVGTQVSVTGVLCFVDADWPLVGGAFKTRDIEVLWPKKLYPKLQAPGDLSPNTIGELHAQLAEALPPA